MRASCLQTIAYKTGYIHIGQYDGVEKVTAQVGEYLQTVKSLRAAKCLITRWIKLDSKG